MHLAVAGLSHDRAPLAVRERLAVVPDDLPGALALLRDRVSEGFILSTCNRVEVYALAPSAGEATRAARDFLVARAGTDRQSAGLRGGDEWAASVYLHADLDAVHHLFRVASGLDSAILGEAEILGQVRFALDAARRAHLAGGTLSQVGAAALACGKHVRARTGIGRQALSMVSIGLREAAHELGGWSGRQVVVVGAGKIAQLTLKHLAKAPGVALTLVGRTSARAEALAERFGIEARPVSDLGAVLAAADALVTCTAAPHCVVHARDVVQAGRAQGDRRLVCLDLGVPRDVDPAVASLPAVRLIDVERVQAIAERNRGQRARESASADAVVRAELARFGAWWRARDVIPTIAELRAAADAVTESEVARALARLPDLTPREQRVVQALARRVAGKLLHSPTVALRESADAGLADATRRLFSRL